MAAQFQSTRASSSVTLIALLPVTLIAFVIFSIRQVRRPRGWDATPPKFALYIMLFISAIFAASGVIGVVGAETNGGVGELFAQRVIELCGRVSGM